MGKALNKGVDYVTGSTKVVNSRAKSTAKPKPTGPSSQIRSAAEIIAAAMNRDAQSAEAQEVRDLRASAEYHMEEAAKSTSFWDAFLGVTSMNANTSISLGVKALTATLRQFQAGVGPWDYKEVFKEKLGLKQANDFWLTADGKTEDLYYDVIGNIHYGYVMASIGYPEDEAIAAANGYSIPGIQIFVGVNDDADDLATRFGYELYGSQPPGTVTPGMIESFIYDNWDYWDEQGKLTDVG